MVPLSTERKDISTKHSATLRDPGCTTGTGMRQLRLKCSLQTQVCWRKNSPRQKMIELRMVSQEQQPRGRPMTWDIKLKQRGENYSKLTTPRLTKIVLKFSPVRRRHGMMISTLSTNASIPCPEMKPRGNQRHLDPRRRKGSEIASPRLT